MATEFPKHVWTPLRTEVRPHDAVRSGDQLLVSYGVVTVASQDTLPDGRVRYRFGTDVTLTLDPSNWPEVVTGGGYAVA